jgi:hypothetical protein
MNKLKKLCVLTGGKVRDMSERLSILLLKVGEV